jgi:ketosteroid isomerase-like protein
MIDPERRPRGPERSLVLIAGLTAVLVVVTIVLAFTLGDREPTTFDPGTPERTVQDYLQALDDGDFEAAYALLSSDYQRTVSLSDFLERERFQFRSEYGADRVTIDDVDVNGETARLRLQLRYVTSDGDGYERQEDVALVRENGAWRLRNPLLL